MTDDFWISLYDDQSDTDKANKEFKELFGVFERELKSLRCKWMNLGANDSAVSECIMEVLKDIVYFRYDKETPFDSDFYKKIQAN